MYCLQLGTNWPGDFLWRPLTLWVLACLALPQPPVLRGTVVPPAGVDDLK